MKYKCKNEICGKQFSFTATKTVTDQEKEIVTIETLVCPYCCSLNFDEIPQEQPVKGVDLQNIASLKDVAPNEVDTFLAQGYVVYQTWQKNVFVVKLKPKETEQTTPAIQFDHVTMEDEQA